MSDPVPTLPDRGELLNLLDAEISHIHSREARGGWNLWGALAASAAAGWMILESTSEKSGAPVSWTNALRIAVAGMLLLDLVLLVRSMFVWTRERKPGSRRYQFTQGLGYSRTLALFGLLRFSAVAVAGYSVSPGTFPFLITALYCGCFIFIVGKGLYRTFKPLAYEDRPVENRFKLWAILVVAVPLSVPIISYGASGSFPNGMFSSQDFKVGGLLVVCVATLWLAAYLEMKVPILDTLVRLRRELVLNGKEVVKIARQLDVALHGMTAVDLVQERLGDFLDCAEELQEHCSAAEIRKSQLVEQVAKVKAAMAANQIEHLVEELYEEAEHYADRLKMELKSVDEVRIQLDRELQLLRADSSGISDNEHGKDARALITRAEALASDTKRVDTIKSEGSAALGQFAELSKVN